MNVKFIFTKNIRPPSQVVMWLVRSHSAHVYSASDGNDPHADLRRSLAKDRDVEEYVNVFEGLSRAVL